MLLNSLLLLLVFGHDSREVLEGQLSLDRLVVGGWGLAAVPAGDRGILATEMIRLRYDIVMVVDASEELLGALVAKAAWVATLIRHALP